MALDVYILPFTNRPQTFTCTLAGIELKFTNKWNAQAGLWFVDIERAADGVEIAASVPLVTGCDLLAPFEYLGLVGHIFCHNSQSDAPPDYDNLGTDCNVYFTPEKIPAFEGY